MACWMSTVSRAAARLARCMHAISAAVQPAHPGSRSGIFRARRIEISTTGRCRCTWTASTSAHAGRDRDGAACARICSVPLYAPASLFTDGAGHARARRPLGLDGAHGAGRRILPSKRGVAFVKYLNILLHLRSHRHPRAASCTGRRHCSSSASALAVIPAAGLLGQATEELAAHTGPRAGRAAERHPGQRRRADHHPVRHPRRAARPGEGVHHRLDHRQCAVGDGRSASCWAASRTACSGSTAPRPASTPRNCSWPSWR